MKKLFALALLILASPLAALAAGDAWTTDVDAAMAKAKAENKVLLMDFTGSDWCVWCQRLDAEVFSKEEFKKYAEANLVLLKLDFPRASKQSAAEKKRNQALLEKYDVKGFPTVLVFNPAGEKIGSLGYQPGGPSAWIASLERATKG